MIGLPQSGISYVCAAVFVRPNLHKILGLPAVCHPVRCLGRLTAERPLTYMRANGA